MAKKTTTLEGDIDTTLGAFQELINLWVKTYGSDAKIETDAGYNNVMFIITKDK